LGKSTNENNGSGSTNIRKEALLTPVSLGNFGNTTAYDQIQNMGYDDELESRAVWVLGRGGCFCSDNSRLV
jgi:hypothetical protein